MGLPRSKASSSVEGLIIMAPAKLLGEVDAGALTIII
jgi:hypothetical protein